jgi:hypothetical protein
MAAFAEMDWQKSRKSSVKLQLYSSKKLSNYHIAFYSIFNDVINIAIKLRATLLGFRIPVGETYIYFLPQLPDWLLGPPCIQWLQGFTLVGKYPDRKANHSSPSSDEVKNEYSSTSTPLSAFKTRAGTS